MNTQLKSSIYIAEKDNSNQKNNTQKMRVVPSRNFFSIYRKGYGNKIMEGGVQP